MKAQNKTSVGKSKIDMQTRPEKQRDQIILNDLPIHEGTNIHCCYPIYE